MIQQATRMLSLAAKKPAESEPSALSAVGQIGAPICLNWPGAQSEEESAESEWAMHGSGLAG